MSQMIYYLEAQNLADGAQAGEYALENDYRIKLASTHQVTVVPAASATGTVKIAYVAIGVELALTTIEYVKDSLGADVEIDLASGAASSYTFEAAVSSIAIVAQGAIAEGADMFCAGW